MANNSLPTEETLNAPLRSIAVLDSRLSPRSALQDSEHAALKLDGLDFRGATLRSVVQQQDVLPNWWNARESRVSVLEADFKSQGMRSVNLSGASLEKADFSGADLAEASLCDTFLGGANFDRALLEDTDLTGAKLRFASFRQAVLEGAKLPSCDLWGAKLNEADADKADFRNAQLEEADFRDADAREVDFRGAKLGLTDFRDADLRRSDFRDCMLRGAKFDKADLRRANLEQLDLTSASLVHIWLSDALLDRARFTREQLGGMIGEEAAGEYELARRGYLALERVFAETGDSESASWAYRKRRRMEKLDARRRAAEAFRHKHFIKAGGAGLVYLNYKTVELICDYGESVTRVLATQAFVIFFYAMIYLVLGSVTREGLEQGTRIVTRSPVDLAMYAMTSMLAPGQYPEGLHPSGADSQLITLSQSYIGIFLIGLLGFVAGNRIRR